MPKTEKERKQYMFKNDYAYKLMEKENKRLVRENQRLRNQIDEISELKNEYQNLIDELKKYKEKYKNALDKVDFFESEMRKEFKRLMK